MLCRRIIFHGSPEQKVILVTLLLMANHAERSWQWQGKPYTCKPGQMITSLKSIQEKCGKEIHISRIRRVLKLFEKMGFLVSIATKDHRLITLCNWERYQITDEPAVTTGDNIVSSSCQDRVTMATPNKNVKNEKKEKKGKDPSCFLSFEEMERERESASATKRR